jgi:ACR3 family arsenite efflux pump ArsB
MFVPVVLVAAAFFGTLVRLLCERRLSLFALVESAVPLMLVALFIMYPLVANVAFEAFSCCARMRQPTHN